MSEQEFKIALQEYANWFHNQILHYGQLVIDQVTEMKLPNAYTNELAKEASLRGAQWAVNIAESDQFVCGVKAVLKSEAVSNDKELSQPPYNCSATGDRRVGNGCFYPNCKCEWIL